MISARVALVTGGARRVGAAIARSFTQRGYDLVIHHGQSSREAEALAADLRQQHAVRVAVVQEDLRDVRAPARVIEAAVQQMGALDVVVSSASVMEFVAFDAVSPEHWEQTEAVNLRAPFFLMQAAACCATVG